MLTQKELLQYLIKGDYETVFSTLQFFFERNKDRHALDECFLLQSRYHNLASDERKGVLDAAEVRRERNAIVQGITELIRKTPAYTESTSAPAVTGASILPSAASPAISMLSYFPLWIGTAVLLAATGIIVAIPCVTTMQFYIVRILAALGIASLTFYLSGYFELQLTGGLRSGGSLGIFALAYLVNPAGGYVGRGCASEVPVTVFAHGRGGPQDLVLRQQGHVLLDYRGERKRMAISENGEAFFSNLKIGETLRIGVDFSEKYVPVRPDSTYVVDESGKIYLEVSLDLGQLGGRVVHGDQPLPDVVVAIGRTLRDTTDALGYYDMNIPPALQRKVQEVTFYKKGFNLLTKKAYPQTREPLNVLMTKATDN